MALAVPSGKRPLASPAGSTMLPGNVVACKEASGFRLVFSDGLISGGQRVKTFNVKPTSFGQVVDRLKEHFGFEEICSHHKIDPTAAAKGIGITVMGFDGRRRVPIHSDQQLAAFSDTLRCTTMPSIEVQLTNASLGRNNSAQGFREPKDQVEELENENFKLANTAQRLERRVDELERRRNQDREETERLVTTARKEITAEKEALEQGCRSEIKALTESNSNTVTDMVELKKKQSDLEKTETRHNRQLTEEIEKQAQKINVRIDDMGKTMEGLQVEDERIAAKADELEDLLNQHTQALSALEVTKVDIETDKIEKSELKAQLQQEINDLSTRLDETKEVLTNSLATAKAELDKADAKLNGKYQEHVDRIDEELTRLSSELATKVKDTHGQLMNVRSELEAKIDADVSALSKKTDASFDETKDDVHQKNEKTNKRVDVLSNKTETTFQGFNQRIEELAKAERIRFGEVDCSITDGLATCRSEFRGEFERLRQDHEQDAARFDDDLNGLHMKHDVTKQEITFFQSRLLEQRDWAQRQFIEMTTATRAAHVDSQEGVAACTKMLHGLRDDQVGFREKMAKHVALLQHNVDSHSEAISSLETQRARIRLDLDTIIGEHTGYVEDMDGWADDVRLKVERLFRALEPPKCEWRIERAQQRGYELKNPLAIKSSSFSLQGLTEVAMEFFPNGHGTSPEGKAVLRLYMPPAGSVRFQCYLGGLTEGSRTWTAGNVLTLDLFFDDTWTEQIGEDGSLRVSMEVLQDKTITDNTLARQVLLESP